MNQANRRPATPFTCTRREVRLVREAGEANEREDRQYPRYHEGKELLALAKRMAKYATTPKKGEGD